MEKGRKQRTDDRWQETDKGRQTAEKRPKIFAETWGLWITTRIMKPLTSVE